MAKGKQKSFTDYLNERLDETETRRLRKAAKLEGEYFNALKQEVNEAVLDYMKKNNLGATQFANMLCCSDAAAYRIIKGNHGFTMATVAHIGAAVGLKPHIVFERKE